MGRVITSRREIPPDVAAAYRRDGFWPDRLVTDAFEAALAAHSDRHAVVDDRFGAITYAVLAEEVERLAFALGALGVQPGDFFVVQLPNWRYFTTFHLALTYLGAVTVNIPTTYRRHEVSFILRATRAAGIVAPDVFRGFDFVSMLAELLPQLPTVRSAVILGEHTGPRMHAWSALMARSWESAGHRASLLRPGPDDVTGVSFTSGTTGEPKGVMHTSNTFAAINESVARAYALGGDEVVFMPAPVGHSIGLMHGVRLALHLGGTLVLQEHWDAGRAIELIAREQATFTSAAPPFLHDLVYHPGLEAAGRLRSLRVFMCGGAFVSERLLRAAREALPATLTTALWGMTEGIGSACRPGAPLERLYTTDGVAFPGSELRVIKSGDESADPGEEGELLMRGPQVFVGYFERPELVAEGFIADGFFRTGDLARIGADGYVNITGRIKEIIVRGGVNISPVEIERALAEDSRIERVAVVGMPDERLGERICAFVVPRAGARVDLADLAAVASRHGLAKQKWPEHLETVTEIPVTPSGKVLRHVLRRWLAERGATGQTSAGGA